MCLDGCTGSPKKEVHVTDGSTYAFKNKTLLPKLRLLTDKRPSLIKNENESLPGYAMIKHHQICVNKMHSRPKLLMVVPNHKCFTSLYAQQKQPPYKLL